jgi:hypothetical protein
MVGAEPFERLRPAGSRDDVKAFAAKRVGHDVQQIPIPINDERPHDPPIVTAAGCCARTEHDRHLYIQSSRPHMPRSGKTPAV